MTCCNVLCDVVKLTPDQLMKAIHGRKEIEGRVTLAISDCSFGMELSLRLEMSANEYSNIFPHEWKPRFSKLEEDAGTDLFYLHYRREWLVGLEVPLWLDDEKQIVNAPCCIPGSDEENPNYAVKLTKVQFEAIKLLSRCRTAYLSDLKAQVAPSMSDKQFTRELEKAGQKISDGIAWKLSIVQRMGESLVIFKPELLFLDGAPNMVVSELLELDDE